MSPRANWKGALRIGDLTCPVALYTAVSNSERIAFHTLNRKTGHRVHRQFIDQDTGEPVEAEDQVKGYEASKGDYVMLEPEEVASAFPQSDKTLMVEHFIDCDKVDDLFFDRPYYLGPADIAAQHAFAVIREGMRKANAAALARAVLFRRVRTVLVRAYERGMIATLLNFDYEVRSVEEAFVDIPALKIQPEMLDLAKHIIKTKQGRFEPKSFHDRYEAALADLVKAKAEGREIKAVKPAPPGNVIDLMDALRRSAGGFAATRSEGKKAPSRRSGTKRKSAAKKPARRATRNAS
jgi:DNA end-binding protein Ku